MIKKGVCFLLLAVFMLSILSVAVTVSAQADEDSATFFASQTDNAPAPDSSNDVGFPQASNSGSSSGTTSAVGGWFSEKWNLWVHGSESLKDSAGRKLVTETLKYFLLVLVVLLAYAALSYASFPDSAILRVILSVVLGFLATFLVTSQELLTILNSYTALGLTLFAFLPIAILGFFSIIVAAKGDPIGIYVQKLMWLAYSLFLFFKGAVVVAANFFFTGKFDSAGVLRDVIPKVTTTNSTLYKIMSPFLPNSQGTGTTAALTSDFTTGVVLVCLAIGIFVIMVLGNDYVFAWIDSEKRKSEIKAHTSRMERSHAYDKMRSDAMKKSGGSE